VARPRIVVLCLGLRASAGGADRVLLVASAPAAAAAGSLLAVVALAGLSIAGWPALVVSALATLPVAAVRPFGWGMRGSDEGGRRGGGRWIRGPGGLAGGDVVDVDLLEQEKRASLLEGGEGSDTMIRSDWRNSQ
jgi:hypothetical protein